MESEAYCAERWRVVEEAIVLYRWKVKHTLQRSVGWWRRPLSSCRWKVKHTVQKGVGWGEEAIVFCRWKVTYIVRRGVGWWRRSMSSVGGR
ncbi:unnamed protein product [Staurois parvus]|uniref:Uncharacterized protein n=1 Tax=Staurois parvus TaxID=386267 RepID=A0ABN9HLZ5_9NEOB|nr:unnamed protein product [Staurois parvus]